MLQLRRRPRSLLWLPCGPPSPPLSRQTTRIQVSQHLTLLSVLSCCSLFHVAALPPPPKPAAAPPPPPQKPATAPPAPPKPAVASADNSYEDDIQSDDGLAGADIEDDEEDFSAAMAVSTLHCCCTACVVVHAHRGIISGEDGLAGATLRTKRSTSAQPWR